MRDPDDARILAEAVGASADVLVTGDKDLLVVAGKIAYHDSDSARFLGVSQEAMTLLGTAGVGELR